MGNQACCKNDQQQLDLHLGPDDNLYQQRFFHFYPQAEITFKSLTFPKNYNKIQMQAVTEFKQQGIFIGKERCRIRTGLGIMIYQKEGFFYIGNFVNHNMQGLGYMLYKDGSYYQGEFYLNKPHGYGEYYSFGKKWIFKGKWKAGVKEGLGEETYPDGAVFTGNYHNDMKEGKGTIFFPNACIYDDRQHRSQQQTNLQATNIHATNYKLRCSFNGVFKNDVATGYGYQRGEDYKYEGQWKDNEMSGAGTTTYYNQDGEPIQFYIGEFKEGVKEGFGEYRWANGRVYKGNWSKGEMTSQGVLIDKRQ